MASIGGHWRALTRTGEQSFAALWLLRTAQEIAHALALAIPPDQPLDGRSSSGGSGVGGVVIGFSAMIRHSSVWGMWRSRMEQLIHNPAPKGDRENCGLGQEFRARYARRGYSVVNCKTRRGISEISDAKMPLPEIEKKPAEKAETKPVSCQRQPARALARDPPLAESIKACLPCVVLAKKGPNVGQDWV
ncbi:MAG: hypothetical protein HYV36_07545 [Lentisphaerae bacterium]|nr:hypothetical protein [Lentisphaerota bacterium]